MSFSATEQRYLKAMIFGGDERFWIPAYAGMTVGACCLGMTVGACCLGMTVGHAVWE